jgi:hypothetical protein
VPDEHRGRRGAGPVVVEFDEQDPRRVAVGEQPARGVHRGGGVAHAADRAVQPVPGGDVAEDGVGYRLEEEQRPDAAAGVDGPRTSPRSLTSTIPVPGSSPDGGALSG